MSFACSRCGRKNPGEARYCYFDGNPLSAQAAGILSPALQPFPTPFVFPAGHACANFDQLALGCQHHWSDAVSLLRNGSFGGFLAGLGRADLAHAAGEANKLPDGGRALDQFLARIPAERNCQPRLDLEPREIQLGPLPVGQDRRFDICVRNSGLRLLFGSVVSDSPWLTPGESNVAQKLVQCSASATVPVTVRGNQLRAGAKPLEGQLIVETNGGNKTIPVRVQVPPTPFADGVLSGSVTPRQIAEKAKKSPHEAAAFFENGAVARWYTANGWKYPVQGEASSGLGAVQQFFEALGLARPPKMEISQSAVELQGRAGESAQHAIQVFTKESRPVYAQAHSDQVWLKVGPARLKGNVATLALEIASVPDQAGQTLKANVRVVTNGNQRFDIPVSLTVNEAFPALQISQRRPRPTAARPRWVHLVPAACLFCVLIGVAAIDLASDVPAAHPVLIVDGPEEKKPPKDDTPVFAVEIQDEPEEKTGGIVPVHFKIEDEPDERTGPAIDKFKVEIKDEPAVGGPDGAVIEKTPRVAFLFDPNWSVFGISTTDAAGPAKNKRLTFSDNGNTNMTLVRVNGSDSRFGSQSGRWLKDKTTEPLKMAGQQGGSLVKADGTWAVGGGLHFKQTLEVVPGQPVVIDGVSRRLLDTVLVRYLIHNKDTKSYNVGFRMEIDTLIGGNDGVPFTVPGFPGLVTTTADFKKPKDMPDFIQALERPDLRDPGTVAHMTLKVGEKIEPPGRVSLTHWSAGNTNWEVPVVPLQNDSAVILYWADKTLKAGEKREIGFSYGLGSVSSSETVGKLGVTLGGSFEPGQTFTVTAYVQKPVQGQTVTLELPDGLERVEGAAMQKVTMPIGKETTSIVTWKAKVLRTGDFPLKVKSSTGVSQTKTLSIASAGPATQMALNLSGGFEPGQVFTVEAKVTDPVPGQTLSLQLPAGLVRVEGEETQKTPPPDGKGDAMVQWKVKVQSTGKFTVRVASSTGLVQAKTITIAGGTGAGSFQMLLGGDFAPGKIFTITAPVHEPLPGQMLTLALPKGLEIIEGAEKQNAEPGKPALLWKIKTLEPGKFALRLQSTTGVTLKKTLVIEPPNDVTGKFNLELIGPIEPGKDFTVIAKISRPLPGQKLTLTLPKELRLQAGTAEQTSPAPSDGVSQVSWQVRVVGSGRLPVRVESSTGIAKTKTISITQTSGATIFGN